MIIGKLINILTGDIISHNIEIDENNPKDYGSGYTYFITYEPYSIIDYDQRYYDYEKDETPTNEPHPIYTQFKKWLIEHQYIKRSNIDIFQSVDNACRLANYSWRNEDLFFIAQGLIQKQLNNIDLTEDEENIMLDYVNRTNKIIQNNQHSTNLKSQIELEQEPNLDEGWEKNT
jgi:hypothetical protein